MSQAQKEILFIDDPKVIKVLEKSFTKQLLGSFKSSSLTAAEVATAITFPKDKIYYHIKKLISLELLYISEIVKIKGVDQKKFLPVAKKFKIIETKLKNRKLYERNNPIKNNELFSESKQNNQTIRKKNENEIEKRSIIQRRVFSDRRIISDDTFNNLERRYKIQRKIDDRRTTNLIYKDEIQLSLDNLKISKNYESSKIKNYNLKLNGVTDAISFVETDSNIIFIITKLEVGGFELKQVKHYTLPMVKNGLKIKTLPELIINVYNQFFSKSKKGKIYLAIHSDKYQYEMTYLNSTKSGNLKFSHWLKNKLENAKIIFPSKNIFDYKKDKENNTVVCYSNNIDQINFDYKILKKAGFNLRYNTSIPKILLNIHNYYNLNSKNKTSIIIYIDQKKTHLVSIYNKNIFASLDIPIGLKTFIKVLVTESSNQDFINEMNKNNAIHYLEKFGILLNDVDETIDVNKIDRNKNKNINKIVEQIIKEIKRFIKELKIYNYSNDYNDQTVNKIFIGGVGSHIKNIDKKINNSLEFGIERIDGINMEIMKKHYNSKRNLWIQTKENSLLRKQENFSKELEIIQEKILNHSNTVEIARSPESVKYRITRLEIDQSSKISLVERQTKKLIKSAEEFKLLKDEYIKEQGLLNTDLGTISKRLEDKTESLLSKYKEYDYLMKRMSEIDFKNDNKIDEDTGFGNKSNQEYAIQIKDASKKRDQLNDQKDQHEKESDDLQLKILGFQEKIRDIELKIGSGYDDVTISEYLVNTIQNTTKAFERSLIVNLKSFDRLKKEDLNALKRVGYLLVQNTEKLKEIRNNYENQNINTVEIFFDKPGEKEYALDVRKKLVPVIDLIIQTSGNLEQIKNYTSQLININIEQGELLLKKKDIYKKLKKKNLNKVQDEQNLILLKNEIDLNQPILDIKKEKRSESLNILTNIRRLVHETKDIINNIKINDESKKLIIENKDKIKIELKTLKIDLENIKKIILENGNNLEKIKNNFIKNNKNYENSLEDLKPEIEKFEFKIASIKEEIDENSNHEVGVSKEVRFLFDRNNQIEKSKFEYSNELKRLNDKKIPLIQEVEKKKRDLNIELNVKQKELKAEKEIRIQKANKTKNFTIKSFFKKEVQSLEKKRVSVQSLLLKSTKDMEKIFRDKHKSKELLDQKVKNKTPRIMSLESQITNWQRLLNQGKKIQNNLNELEDQRSDWEEYISKEKLVLDSKIDDLNDNIKRKEKKSYLLFLKESLMKSNNNADVNKLAEAIVKENISSDTEEIENLKNIYSQIKKRYQLFIINYKKSHKKIIEELKPFGGQEKIVKRKIKNANKKIAEAKRIIKSYQKKLDEKNKVLEEKEIEFIRFNAEVQKKSDDIQNEINQIPQKQLNAKEEIEEKLKNELNLIKEDQNQLKEQYKINLIQLDADLQNNDIIIQINNINDNLKNEREEFLINEVNHKKLNISLKNIRQTLSRLNEQEKKYREEYLKLKTEVDEVKSNFELKDKILHQDLKNEEKYLFNNQEKENEYNQKQRQLKLEKIKLDNDLKKIKKLITQYKKKINIPFEKVETIINEENKKNNNQLNEIDRYKNLIELEKDFTTNISRYDNDIKELYKVLDAIQNQESSLIKKINMLDEDIDLLKRDGLKIEKLVDSNNSNRNQIGTKYLKILEKLEEVQNIYFPSKTMLNDRIDNIYNLIEKNKNQKNKLKNRLSELEKRLKTKRIKSAEVDNQLSLINKNMKKVLELSIHDDESQRENNNLDTTQEKIQSYVDLVDMKSRTKQLFNNITEVEKDISILKEKKFSINRIITENEKINQKKIKRLEETCSVLEKKIMIDKDELSVLEKKLKELNRNASNYGSRIEFLEKELKDFKQKEKKYEEELKELDRSLEKIKIKGKISQKLNKGVFENTIEIDYMANLGLFMDSKNQLNLIPGDDKKDYQFFRSNKILRNSFLTLVIIFTLATYAQKTQIDPLINLLPKKSSELTLLNMRQDMKEEIEKEQKVFNGYELLINKDKNLSINMINAVKYLTQITPKRFKVTELKLDNEDFDLEKNLKNGLYKSNLCISIKGFYGLDKSEAEIVSKSFISLLKDSEKFKSIIFSDGEKISKWRTNYDIKLVM